jgi:hypothetical protein
MRAAKEMAIVLDTMARRGRGENAVILARDANERRALLRRWPMLGPEAVSYSKPTASRNHMAIFDEIASTILGEETP